MKTNIITVLGRNSLNILDENFYSTLIHWMSSIDSQSTIGSKKIQVNHYIKLTKIKTEPINLSISYFVLPAYYLFFVP